MKTLLTAILLLASLVSSSTRYDTGVFTAKCYHEEGDYTSMTFTTSDGTAHTIDDYIAPLGDSALVFYDSSGQITAVISLSLPRQS